MKTPDDIQIEHRRLAILRALVEGPANDSLLLDVVRGFYFRLTRDQLRGDLAWLREQRLIEVRELAGLWLSSITERGGEVAQGHADHPGVKRPSPKV